VKQVAEIIEKAHAETVEGTFVPLRDMNELNYALQSKEHLGCTRGYGNIPWKHAWKSTVDSYRKKRKHDELLEDKIQETVQNILQTKREKMHASFQGHIQEHMQEPVQSQLQQILAEPGNALVLHNPGGYRSSCTSTTTIENGDNRYPIDDLEESK
jgi:phage baseplate assembly protein W